MENGKTVFDVGGYKVINEARKSWLANCLDDIPFRSSLNTAVDIGCGAGYFSETLAKSGFKVTGVDLQRKNIEICQQRYSYITFLTLNLDEDFENLGKFDLALMFGILYHLQSPLQTIFRLREIIGRIGIVETRVAPGTAMACYLYHEFEGDAHNLARITAVPTFSAIVRIFQCAGFDYVYRPSYQPEHEHWVSVKNGQRHCFIVAREPIDVPNWQRLEGPSFIKKWEPMLVPMMI